MKKTLAIILSLVICVMSGCHAGDSTLAATETTAQTQPTLDPTGPAPSTETETNSASEELTQSTEGTVSQETEQRVTEETVPETTVPPTTVPKETEPAQTEPPATEATVPQETITEDTQPQETQATETMPADTQPSEAETTETEPTETEATEPEATESFEPTYELKRQIASYAAQYINQYRGTPCTVLSGMSQVAQYRAGQLCYNFSHSTADKRAALAYYEYGRWIDATLAGLEESDSYYESDTSEAICRGFRGSDAEALGRALADAIHSSGSHWAYVGSSEYSYMGIGVEYHDGMWYACVMVGTVNYG